jgi:glucose 1-dehydrogenase
MTMRAITVKPGTAGSIRLVHVGEPNVADGDLLVETLAVGVCGTDIEIAAGRYGTPPPGRDHLIIGHEAIGRVREAPSNSGFTSGQLVVPIVRRPDPIPCRFCAAGEWDMCRNGLYTERGIKERDGFASERFRVEAAFAIPIPTSIGLHGVLVEPASIVAKAWMFAERIGARSSAWQPRVALVTGAGPIGLLAALMGRQRGLEVHVLDRVTAGLKPELVGAIGAVFHSGGPDALAGLEPDVVIECTGAPAVIAEVITGTAPSGIVCLAGLSSGGHQVPLDLGDLNRRMVLENDAIFGSVNANRTHYALAVAALTAAQPAWLARVITRRVAIDHWPDGFQRQQDDVKTIIEFGVP